MERGKFKDPGKQERLNNYKTQFKGGNSVILLWHECTVKNSGRQILCLQQQSEQQKFKISTPYGSLEF